MSDQEQETIADIVREMRDAATSAEAWHASIDANVVMDFADRVEIAARRERDHAVEHATRHAEAVARDNCRDCVHNPNGHNYEGGNAAAMREALENVAGYAETARRHTEDVHILSFLDEIEGWARSALSKPPRQCDMGTVEEQTRRMFEQYCSEQISCYELPSGEHCPLHFEGVDCHLAWAQMPYEAQSQEGAGK